MKLMFDLNERVVITHGENKGVEGFVFDIVVNENNDTVYAIKFSEYDDLLFMLAKDLESLEEDPIPCPITLGEYEKIVKEREEKHGCCGGNCGCDGNCGDACKCKHEKDLLEIKIPVIDKETIKENFNKFIKKLKIK